MLNCKIVADLKHVNGDHSIRNINVQAAFFRPKIIRLYRVMRQWESKTKSAYLKPSPNGKVDTTKKSYEKDD